MRMMKVQLQGILAMTCTTTACMLAGVVCAQEVAEATQPTHPSIAPPERISPPGIPVRSREKTGDELVQMQIAADVTHISPGKKFHLAFIFEVEPHWHIYWENAGDSGGPTEIDVSAPPGFTVGRTLFTRPQTLITDEGTNYGYEGTAVLFVEITPPLQAVAQIGFNAEANWLVCKDVCKMGSAKGMISLPFGEGLVPSATKNEVPEVVVRHKKRLPGDLSTMEHATIGFDGKHLTVALPADGRTGIEFFPNPSPGVTFGEAKSEVKGDTLHIMIPVALEPRNALGQSMRLAGVIGLGRNQDDPCFSFDISAEGQDGGSVRE